jgi:hypothetical protein
MPPLVEKRRLPFGAVFRAAMARLGRQPKSGFVASR